MVKESYSFDQKTDIRNTQGSDVIGIYKIDIDDSTNRNLKKGNKPCIFKVNYENGDFLQ